MSMILITGGAGSIGKLVARRLAERGHAVRAMDLPTANWSGLDEVLGLERVHGDISDGAAVRELVRGVDVVLHLAALLPPISERDRTHTMRVNVGGTQALIGALVDANPDARLVLSSSVCVYGDTSALGDDHPPITVDQPCAPFDLYGQSKVLAEQAVRDSGLDYAILRISGVAVPAFLAPPDPWPFRNAQRIEFVARDDVVRALVACVARPASGDMTLNVAGGPTWRMTGAEHAAVVHEALGLERDDARFCQGPCAFDWYDTDATEAALGLKPTPFADFCRSLEAAIAAALGLD